MRLKLQTRPLAMFGAMLVVAMIVLMPMRLVLILFGLGDVGLSARAVSGPVWLARLSEAHLGDIDLGDVTARLSPIQLLVGRARIDLNGVGREGAPPMAGAIGLTRHSVGLDDMTATLPVGTIFAPLPVSQVVLDDLSVRFDGGKCSRAEGRVRAVLGGSIAGVPLAQGMSGSARCSTGDLIVPLASQAGTETITLRIKADGRYRADLSISPSDAQTIQAVTAIGFQSTRSGYGLSVEGHF